MQMKKQSQNIHLFLDPFSCPRIGVNSYIFTLVFVYCIRFCIFVFVYFVVEDIPRLPLLHDPFSCPQPHVSIPSIPGGGALQQQSHFTSLHLRTRAGNLKKEKEEKDDSVFYLQIDFVLVFIFLV